MLQSHIFVLDRERENNKHLIQPLLMRQHWVENTKLEFPGNPMWPLTGNSNYAQVLLCACISTHVAHSDINPFKRSDMSYFSEVGRCLPGGAVSALRIKTDGGCKNPLCLSPTTERQGREKSVTLPTGGKKEQTGKRRLFLKKNRLFPASPSRWCLLALCSDSCILSFYLFTHSRKLIAFA